ncbi:IclR family transcriptional regulator [Pseudomonas aeruginosa]|uniref:IclR family transcriptional regulator n=1 Tax=Pseudomonas aeruginosa TaxID=287 RepID=UPI00053E1089|nr:IclR family transcriptional regulator [Pseudomonas aeruginosa]
MDERNQQAGNDERSGGIQVIARAARIMYLLGKKPDGLSLGDIAQEVGLPRSTVQRIVGALEDQGMVRSEGIGGISLGAGLLRLVTYAHADRITVLGPWLQRLSETINETVVLSRPSGLQLVVEHRIVADRELLVMPRLGQLDKPLYGTSAGRAILALDSDEEVRGLLQTEGFTPPDTVSAEKIFKQLDVIRQTKVSCDHGELMEGITTTAIALDTVLGRFAISMPVPTFRFEKEKENYILELLRCKAGVDKEIGLIS